MGAVAASGAGHAIASGTGASFAGALGSAFGSVSSNIGPILSIGGTLLSSKGRSDSSKAQAEVARIQDQALQTQVQVAQAQAVEAEVYAANVAKNALISSEFEAMQADYLAKQAIAFSHKEAFEQRRAAGLLSSRALAIAAASGAGASDQTVVQLISEVNAEGAYRSALAMYEGEESARSYTVAGLARRLSGESSASAIIAEGRSRANAKLIEAGSIDMSRYANATAAKGTAKANKTAMYSSLLSGASSLLKLYGDS